MKNNYMTVLFIELCFLLFSFFCIWTFSNINLFLYLALILVISIILRLLLKPKKRSERFSKDIMLMVCIVVLFYYAFTYLSGFFFGFIYSNFSKRFLGILLNIGVSLALIFSVENIRNALVYKSDNHKTLLFLAAFVCFLLEIPTMINIRAYTSQVDFLNAFMNLLLPSLVKNFMLTWVNYKSNKNNCITYQLLMSIPNYFLPVFPNLGDFFSIIANITLPVIVLVFSINLTIVKSEKISNSRSLRGGMMFSKISNIILVSFVIIMIYLTSNMFRFTSMAIGSPSMTGSINKGDIVIIDKKIKKAKLGQVIAFKQDNKIVVHRVIEVIDQKEGKYGTKGDYNNDKDGWIVKEENIVGAVVFKIKWLGWPTVALSELLQNNR